VRGVRTHERTGFRVGISTSALRAAAGHLAIFLKRQPQLQSPNSCSTRWSGPPEIHPLAGKRGLLGRTRRERCVAFGESMWIPSSPGRRPARRRRRRRQRRDWGVERPHTVPGSRRDNIRTPRAPSGARTTTVAPGVSFSPPREERRAVNVAVDMVAVKRDALGDAAVSAGVVASGRWVAGARPRVPAVVRAAASTDVGAALSDGCCPTARG